MRRLKDQFRLNHVNAEPLNHKTIFFRKEVKHMKKGYFVIGLTALFLFMTVQAFAHTPICSCYGNGDGSITCEGGFSDGSSAAGVEMRVVASDGKVLIKGKMNQDSEFTFKRPSGPFKVQFDAGEGHLVEVEGKAIAD
jgi:hypothetical protein